jgi:hypothetical protein
MSLSFTEEYFPDIDALTASTLADAREMVVRILQPSMPDVDLSPGTPTGDLVVSVLGAHRAAAQEANSRLMSDLNLENVANGIIFSCNFVRAYLGNFGVYDVENLRAAGLVRLTYSSPVARTLPLAIRFRFGNTDDYHLVAADSGSSHIRLLAAGVPHDGQPDTYQLSQTSASSWAVDVPLYGNLTAPVARGTAGTATIISDDLIGMVSAIDFLPGIPTATLKDLARMARKAAFSLTSGSRASTTALVLRNWPETAMVSPVVSGDAEMLRSPAGSAMVMQRPAIDLYMRSARDMQRETQVVRLEYVPSLGGVFRGQLNLLHTPSRILSIEWSGSTGASVVSDYTVFTNTTRRELYGNQHCGTRYEALYAEVVPTGADAITRSGSPGELYAMFTVTYDADPLLQTVASTLEAPDNVPPGVSMLVKSGPLVLVDTLNIDYTKKQGTRTTLGVAREKIRDYFKGAGYPDVFRQTQIHDIMVGAGVERVTNITCTGRILISAAERRLTALNTDTAAMAVTADWHAQSDIIAVPTITSVAQIVPNVIMQEDGSAGGIELWAATRRTARYYVDLENINFTELP